MKCWTLGSSFFILSCMSSNPETRNTAILEGVWIRLKTEIFNEQGNRIGSNMNAGKECNSYLKVSSHTMETFEPITATGEAASQFSRCYTRRSFSYERIGKREFKSKNDSIVNEDGNLVFIRKYATLSGKEEPEISKVYYVKIEEQDMNLSKCGCFQ